MATLIFYLLNVLCLVQLTQDQISFVKLPFFVLQVLVFSDLALKIGFCVKYIRVTKYLLHNHGIQLYRNLIIYMYLT